MISYNLARLTVSTDPLMKKRLKERLQRRFEYARNGFNRSSDEEETESRVGRAARGGRDVVSTDPLMKKRLKGRQAAHVDALVAQSFNRSSDEEETERWAALSERPSASAFQPIL